MVYPYLLRNLIVSRPNQVWCADVTYIPSARAFVYLVAVMDWHSHTVLSRHLSSTMYSQICVGALEEAIERYGVPEIFNTEQVSRFTSDALISVLEHAEIRVSMDGKGRWLDNVFIERLWRSVKYEEVYLKADTGMVDAKRSLDRYFSLYNEKRRHQGLDDNTTGDVYYQAAYAMVA